MTSSTPLPSISRLWTVSPSLLTSKVTEPAATVGVGRDRARSRSRDRDGLTAAAGAVVSSAAVVSAAVVSLDAAVVVSSSSPQAASVSGTMIAIRTRSLRATGSLLGVVLGMPSTVRYGRAARGDCPVDHGADSIRRAVGARRTGRVIWSPSDEALVAGLAAGDASAATAFVRRFQARVFGLAVTMVGDAAVAEEIAQEAFTRAWRHAGAYDARRGRVATWLLSITRNLAIDHLRAKRTEPLDPDAIGDAERALWAAAGPPGRGRARTRASCATRSPSCPAEQRRALLLAALFGFTAREIGEIEHIPLGTAKTRIRDRGRRSSSGGAATEPRSRR